MKLVDLTTAKALQALGYDGEYAKSYTDFGDPTIDITTNLIYPTEIPAPRLDDAAYFLRDEYGIFIDIRYTRDNIRKGSKRSWAYILKEMDSMAAQYGDSFYCSYELALEAAVTKVRRFSPMGRKHQFHIQSV